MIVSLYALWYFTGGPERWDKKAQEVADRDDTKSPIFIEDSFEERNSE